MGILLALAVGYVVGAKAGNEGFEEVVASVSAIRESEEFQGFLQVMRSHLGNTLRDLGGRLADADHSSAANDVLSRVRSMFPSTTTTFPAS